jgi:hypothetical protein
LLETEILVMDLKFKKLPIFCGYSNIPFSLQGLKYLRRLLRLNDEGLITILDQNNDSSSPCYIDEITSSFRLALISPSYQAILIFQGEVQARSV